MDKAKIIEALEDANRNLPTMDIRGKKYVMVKDRVKAFRKSFPDYSLTTEIVHRDDVEIIFKASVLDPDGRVQATGHAKEEANGSNILRTSHVEVAETSAIGRALGAFGIGIDDNFGSAEEIANAQMQQAFITQREFKNLTDLCKNHGKDMEWLLATAGAPSGREITVEGYAKVVKLLDD